MSFLKNPLRIGEGVYVFQSDLWMINSVSIINDLGSVVIDPAFFPDEINDIVSFVKNKNGQTGYCIFTHSDFDHIIGYKEFAAARTVGSYFFSKCDSKEQLSQLMETDLAFEISREDFIFPELDVVVEDEFIIPLKNGRLILKDAPGHTADSIFTLFPEKGIIFAGDTLSDVEFPFIYHSSRDYRKTLALAEKLVDKYDLEVLVPGHGNMAFGREAIDQRIQVDLAYLDQIRAETLKYYRRGLKDREIVSALMEFQYNGEPIEGSMMRMHVDNVKQVIMELKEEQ